MRPCKLLAGLLVGAMLAGCHAEPGAVAIDGDTVIYRGERVRLIGLDAPELRARCPAEYGLAVRAKNRLQALIDTRKHVNMVVDSCAGRYDRDRYGRRCGVLWVDGRDAADIMIAEGLARRYVCAAGHCPQRQPWCAQ